MLAPEELSSFNILYDWELGQMRTTYLLESTNINYLPESVNRRFPLASNKNGGTSFGLKVRGLTPK